MVVTVVVVAVKRVHELFPSLSPSQEPVRVTGRLRVNYRKGRRRNIRRYSSPRSFFDRIPFRWDCGGYVRRVMRVLSITRPDCGDM